MNHCRYLVQGSIVSFKAKEKDCVTMEEAYERVISREKKIRAIKKCKGKYVKT